MLAAPPLVYRTINPHRDAALAVAHQRAACIASFGNDSRFQGAARYLAWLRSRVEEFPDGNVLAFLGDRCVGHLELQVPYGATTGYVNLYYVTPEFRGQGYGRLLHDHAERYFRSWEARRIELHVSPTNEPAIGFYRRMGYKLAGLEKKEAGLWRMAKTLIS